MTTLLHAGATVLCQHGGQAQPIMTSPRVKVGGQPIALQNAPYSIAGCPFPPPPAGNGPCVMAQWTSGATRVKSMGVPVLLKNSQAVCTPTGTGVQVVMTQLRVKGK